MPKPLREKLKQLLYDDMCHLKPFSENDKRKVDIFAFLFNTMLMKQFSNYRAHLNEVTRFFAQLSKHVDTFHFKGHKVEIHTYP